MAGRHRRRPQRLERLGRATLALTGAGTVVAVLTGAGSHPAPAPVAQNQPVAGKPITSTDASSSRGLSAVTPVTQPQPIHADVSTVAQKSVATLSTRLVSQARSWLGTPYAWGGNSKSGVDCSGLVQQVLKSQGISAPRTAAQQAKWTERISKSEARAGDLVFGTDGGVHHVGIYLGNNQMIDAPTYGEDVGVHKLYSDMNLFGRIPS